jgi:hypothetical protein
MIVNIAKWILFMFVITKAQLFHNNTLDNDNNNATAASRRKYQITMILDRLLKNYDAQIRPNFGGRRNS